MKKKLLIICSLVQLNSMVYGSAAANESKPLSRRDVWPIMSDYRSCLENALDKAGLKHVLTGCEAERKKELEDKEGELGLPKGKLQSLMDQQAERRRQGHVKSEGEAACTGHDAEKANRVKLRHYLRPIREKYRNCLENGLPENHEGLLACQAKRHKALEDLGLNEDKLEELRAQWRAERSC